MYNILTPLYTVDSLFPDMSMNVSPEVISPSADTGETEQPLERASGSSEFNRSELNEIYNNMARMTTLLERIFAAMTLSCQKQILSRQGNASDKIQRATA